MTLKACYSTREPGWTIDDRVRGLDIDIGVQANAGANSVVLGDIEKPRDGTDKYILIERRSNKPLTCLSDHQGCVWILFGTDSGYEARPRSTTRVLKHPLPDGSAVSFR